MSGPFAAPDGSLSYRPAHRIAAGFALMYTKTVHRRSGVYWWTTQTPEGIATVAFRQVDDGFRADGWGPGMDWAFTQFPALLGADDNPEEFRRGHPVVAALMERVDGARVGRTDRWYEALTTATIGQRVVKTDAASSRLKLAERYGEPAAVGPSAAFPTPTALLALRDHDFHRSGVERSRARVLRIAAKYHERIERLGAVAPARAAEWLEKLPGVGPWTAALTTSVAGGDADAVPVGDLHLPRLVTFALTGEEGDDERMLEVLEPFAGHRHRVVRLAKIAGAAPPHRAPRPFRYDISRL